MLNLLNKLPPKRLVCKKIIRRFQNSQFPKKQDFEIQLLWIKYLMQMPQVNPALNPTFAPRMLLAKRISSQLQKSIGQPFSQ